MITSDAIQSSCRKLAATCLVFMVITGIYSAVPAAGSAVRTLYLIRHGEYDHDDTRDPDIGKGLVPLGVTQAELIAARLAAMPVTMTSLHSSSMTRARETAQIVGHLFPNLTLQSSRDLRECTPPTHREDIMAELAEEEATQCRLQLEQAFSHYFQLAQDSDAHDIIVCHGNVIRYFVCRALGEPTTPQGEVGCVHVNHRDDVLDACLKVDIFNGNACCVDKDVRVSIGGHFDHGL